LLNIQWNVLKVHWTKVHQALQSALFHAAMDSGDPPGRHQWLAGQQKTAVDEEISDVSRKAGR